VKQTTDLRDKLAIHRALEGYRAGRLSRRQLVKALAVAGVALSSAPRWGSAAMNRLALARLQEASPVPADVTTYLTDVGSQFKGTAIKVVTEDTAPGAAINALKAEQFEAITGITVNWEVVPLDQVLSKVSIDAAQKSGANDIYYFDQAWVGRFINDTLDPRELLETKPDLAFPNYNFDDFLQPLVQHIAMFGDKVIGAPCDVPIFMYSYRSDIYQELGLQPATTMQQYLDNARTINEAKGAEGIYGTIGQMKSGHYALECDMTAWVWAHGGSVFTADGQCSLNDEQGVQGLEYMRTLQQYMPSAVTSYDWTGQFTAFQQGQGGQVITWSENFPGWDKPDSAVTGLLEPAPLPQAVALRPAAEAGFEETPEVGHQGGSTYCLSRYSKNADAAWVFLQWATSSDTQTRASIIGGGASGMRQSTYDDPRIAEMKQKGIAGTTRHFDTMYEVITTRMGTEPHLPQWPAIATDVIAIELGKMTTGGYGSTQEAADAIKQKVDEAAS